VVAAAIPEPIVSVFLSTGTAQAAETVAYGSEYLRVRSVEFVFMGVLQVLLGAYRGAGSTTTAMAFSMVTLWLGRVPVVYLLAFHTTLGATGIWVGMATGNVLGAVAAALWFTRGAWKETVIEEPSASAD
jgi:Na+-driven multidrug efflux pump